MANLHNELVASKYPESDVGQFLTRLAYCFFAEDTGIFNNKQFLNYIIKNSNDCAVLGSKLDDLFMTLNKPKEERQRSMDAELYEFPYLNGQMFEDRIETAHFTSQMRNMLIKAARFDWSFVSPVIFGSLFESVISSKARRMSGSHYTSETNVLKVINPLFMNKLWEEFDKIKNGRPNTVLKNLKQFQIKLSKLKFLDPACGSGSFLIVTYQEIRRLELEVIKELHKEQTLHDSTILSKIDVNQFYGIEKNRLPVRITESALWMVDHLMNRELEEVYEGRHIRIPLKKHPNIYCKDALEIDWKRVLDPKKCSYIFGNPLFGGIREISHKQNKQLAHIANIDGGAGMLDYVAAWFIKAVEYAAEHTAIGFVATNSITQGVQVEQLWPIIFKKKFKIVFAYQTFKWGSELKDNANVTVVIIGLSKNHKGKKTLYRVNGDSVCPTSAINIDPYLQPYKSKMLVVSKATKPLNGLPQLLKGMAITDDNNYVFDENSKQKFIENEPSSEPYFRPYITARGLLHSQDLWVLLVFNISPNELQKMPGVKKLVENVREFRKRSRKENTRRLAENPKQFERPIIPLSDFLVIPVVQSSKREYMPIDYLHNPYIASAANIICESPTFEQFALLSSHMHMVWFKRVGGRLKEDLRYSNLVYNTFPVPNNYMRLKSLGEEILNVRRKYKTTSTLADLYDRDSMPSDLKNAHLKLDRITEKLYRKTKFVDDDERIEHLSKLYDELVLNGQAKLKLKP